MIRKTCAACDCELDGQAIKVNVGNDTVEVCCHECALRLREAHHSPVAPNQRAVMSQDTRSASHHGVQTASGYIGYTEQGTGGQCKFANGDRSSQASGTLRIGVEKGAAEALRSDGQFE